MVTAAELCLFLPTCVHRFPATHPCRAHNSWTFVVLDEHRQFCWENLLCDFSRVSVFLGSGRPEAVMVTAAKSDLSPFLPTCVSIGTHLYWGNNWHCLCWHGMLSLRSHWFPPTPYHLPIGEIFCPLLFFWGARWWRDRWDWELLTTSLRQMPSSPGGSAGRCWGGTDQQYGGHAAAGSMDKMGACAREEDVLGWHL